MELLTCTCPHCGGELQITSATETAACLYCGRQVVLGDAVRNTVYVELRLQTLKRDAETLYEQRAYLRAEELFRQLTQEYPDAPDGWWGLVRIETDYFTKPIGIEALLHNPDRTIDQCGAMIDTALRAVALTQTEQRELRKSQVLRYLLRIREECARGHSVSRKENPYRDAYEAYIRVKNERYAKPVFFPDNDLLVIAVVMAAVSLFLCVGFTMPVHPVKWILLILAAPFLFAVILPYWWKILKKLVQWLKVLREPRPDLLKDEKLNGMKAEEQRYLSRFETLQALCDQGMQQLRALP